MFSGSSLLFLNRSIVNILRFGWRGGPFATAGLDPLASLRGLFKDIFDGIRVHEGAVSEIGTITGRKLAWTSSTKLQATDDLRAEK
jgi:hypothetical protein